MRSITQNRPARRIEARDVRAAIPPNLFYQREFPDLRVRGKWAQVRCSFHDDRNPSLSINLESGAFRCFGCGSHGSDVIAFAMQRRDLPFRETLDALADEWGIAR